MLQQRPFDDMDPMYTDKMDADMKKRLFERQVVTYDGPGTKLLVHELFEFIVMNLSKEPEKQEEVDTEQPYVHVFV